MSSSSVGRSRPMTTNRIYIFSNRATERDSISDIYRALNLVLTKLAHAKCRKCVQYRRLTVDTWRLPISYNLICRFNFFLLFVLVCIRYFVVCAISTITFFLLIAKSCTFSAFAEIPLLYCQRIKSHQEILSLFLISSLRSSIF